MKIDPLKSFQYLPTVNDGVAKTPTKSILGDDNLKITSSRDIDEAIPDPVRSDKLGTLISNLYNYQPPQMPNF